MTNTIVVIGGSVAGMAPAGNEDFGASDGICAGPSSQNGRPTLPDPVY